jgi:redox-sensitive bicupin YhaK (pirin superfamily)
MKTDAVFTRPIRTEQTSRQIALRTRGHSHGLVTRLVSPGDIGELIKPFVFLDYFDADPATAPKFGFHPHSGIATLTLILAGQAFYKETTGREGVIETGGVEWMRASSGVWHTGGMFGKERIKGFQLWIAMPPELELAEPQSQYLGASDFHFAGPARVIAGEYDGVKSIVGSPRGVTYLDVRLKAGERWIFHPTKGHDVAWIASHQGIVTTPEQVSTGEVAVFEDGDQAIEFVALSDAGFILGSAPIRPGDGALLCAYQHGFLAHWGEQHRRYRPAAAQPGCVVARKTLRIGEISLVDELTMEETDVWIRWNSAFSTHSRGPGVPGQVRSTLAAPIRTLPGPGERPRDRHTARRHYRGSSQCRDERGDSSALKQKRLERPRGSMGALTRAGGR